MGCTSARPALPRMSSGRSKPKEDDKADLTITAFSSAAPRPSDVAAAAARTPANVAHRSVSVVMTSIDPNKPTAFGVALEYIKSLCASLQNHDMLASEFFGDHDEFCFKLAQKPSTAHFLKRQADVFICFPSNCTVQTFLQSLSEVRESPLFIWVDGMNTKTNGAARSQVYWTEFQQIYRTISKGIVISSPWSEPSPLPAVRCVELYFAKTCAETVLVAASKKECDEFMRKMREKPLGPTKFYEVLDHEVEDTATSTPISEIIRENFVQIRHSCESLFRILVIRLAEEMLNGPSEADEERQAIVKASRASLFYVCGELDESMKYFQEAHTSLLKARNTPFAASVLHNIAKVHEDQGQIQQAMELYERCLLMEDPMSKMGMKLSSGDLLNQKTPTNQSIRASLRGDGSFWRDSFTIPSPHDIGGATTMLNLACLLANKGETERAEKLLQESLSVRKAFSRDGESLEVAWCMNTMAVFYERMGKASEAAEYYQNALALRRKLNCGETLVSESLENLGGFLLRDEQRRQESKNLLEESLALRVKKFGLDSVPVARTLVVLAMWWESEDSAKSKGIAKEAFDILAKSNVVVEAQQVMDHFDL